METVLADIHQTFFCADTVAEVEAFVSLHSEAFVSLHSEAFVSLNFSATEGVPLDRFRQAYINLKTEVGVSSDLLRRLLGLLHNIERLQLFLPKDATSDVFINIDFPNLVKFSTNAPHAVIENFLSAHPQIRWLSLDRPVIPNSLQPIAPFMTMNRLLCPVALLRDVHFPLSRLQALYLDINSGQATISEDLQKMASHCGQKAIFAELTHLSIQIAPSDICLINARQSVDGPRAWDAFNDEWHDILLTLPSLQTFSLATVSFLLEPHPLGDLLAEDFLVRHWAGGAMQVPHPALRCIIAAYPSWAGSPPEIASFWKSKDGSLEGWKRVNVVRGGEKANRSIMAGYWEMP
ncbi:uncharacterized protein BXZ73DRAFT_81546 [Epithele typhae]|uniref:uncharacterized protein n=1 Tax=Epithele typhae TaxID=378194 RepID=UPI0020082A47|nr:uncharacterized protein BXZ73DRAFT_81546 [Epithele typhae]KAH9914786.1 hypothetical protein BXZ73DRAFT_81546 [Epithele typhae]